jgi:hypothetical protein
VKIRGGGAPGPPDSFSPPKKQSEFHRKKIARENEANFYLAICSLQFAIRFLF